MPLPLFLGIAAGIAALGGVGSGIHGAVKMKDANDTMKTAQSRHEKNMKKFEYQNTKTTKCMDELGKKEMEILSSFERFSDLIEKIQNRPEFDDIVLNGNVIPKYDEEQLKKVSIGACALMAGLGGAALGTAGGFAAAGATTAAVMALGTASTGTAIASLSGIAATNATLAALGGGAIAAGGGGIALGTTMLGVTTAGIGLLVGGIVFSVTGSSINKKADMAYSQMLEAETKINEICAYLLCLQSVAQDFNNVLCLVDKIYREHLNKMAICVDVQNKTDWLDYTDEDKLLVKNTVMLVGLLYKLCNTKMVLKANSDSEMNKINDKEISEVRLLAINVVEELANAEKGILNNEAYCVATVAVITYFAKCDGELSDDESDILLETVEILRNNILLSDKAYEDIDSILDKDNFTFYQMCSYLDMLDVDELLTFEEIIENVISASDGISEAEEKAKDKFYAYLAERKAN